jgi:uncharacterized protein YfiM (DUF2279 family)
VTACAIVVLCALAATTLPGDTVIPSPAPSFSLTARPLPLEARRPRRHDPWIAQDKAQHFAMSFAVTAFAYGGGRAVLDPDPAVATAVSTAIVAGLGKEIRDARTGRWFSLPDMAWNLAGVGLGLVYVRQIR